MNTSTTVRERKRRPDWARVLWSSRPGTRSTDLGLGAARVALAWIFVYHGTTKLFGWFNGPGLHRTAIYFSEVAHLHPGGLFAVIGGVTETLGGLAVAVGFMSRLAAIALFGDMVVAMITVTWANGILSGTPTPGYELNLSLGVLALVIASLGSGRLSLDTVMERHVLARRRLRGGDSSSSE